MQCLNCSDSGQYEQFDNEMRLRSSMDKRVKHHPVTSSSRFLIRNFSAPNRVEFFYILPRKLSDFMQLNEMSMMADARTSLAGGEKVVAYI